MSFPLKNGSTRNIADAPTKVFGKLMAVSTSQTKSEASSKLEKRFYLPSRRLMNVLSEVNTKFGFGKIILRTSLHFLLMVDLLKKDSVNKIQSKVTKFIKRWLNLPKCCTLASIFHPEVLKLSFLPHCQESAKSSLVSLIESSKDPLVKECVALLFDPEFISRNQFPTECPTFLQRARDSISHATDSSRPPSVKSIILKSLHQKHTRCLEHLP